MPSFPLDRFGMMGLRNVKGEKLDESEMPIRLDGRIALIDGFDMDIPSRTGIYVIEEEELTLIEALGIVDYFQKIKQ